MQKSNFKIILFEPEIPQNTGNIVRLCACTGADLYLVGKLGFSLAEKHLKRAGLDYWDDVNIKHVNTLDEVINENPDSNVFYLTTKAKEFYTDKTFKNGDLLVFGPESRGLPKEIVENENNNRIKIPMVEGKRSLNLSNSVAIVLYEAIRQNY